MEKSKIVTIAETGKNQWKDKTLTKHFILFENGKNGTLTTGFDDAPAPVVGDELEFDLVDNGFGLEVKLPRKNNSFKGGGGAKKWSAEQIAQQDAVKLTSSYLSQRTDVSGWKQFFVECKEFMIAQIKQDESPKPQPSKEPAQEEEKANKLPF